MNPLNVVVPFAVFTEYRNRRALRADIAGATPPAAEESGCVDTSFASAETTVRAQPIIERNPS